MFIRRANERDLEEILKIERECFEEPWTEELFKMLLTYGSKVTSFHNFYVYSKKNKVIGYVIWENELLFNDVKEKYTLIGHIMNLAISREERRKGYGKKLLKFAINQMSKIGLRFCYLEVRESNKAAIKLYKSTGMVFRRKIKDYYKSEDGLYYSKNLG